MYGYDAGAIERVDLLVGTLAESERPTCYGFGETLFQVFTAMATRRLHADRFYTRGVHRRHVHGRRPGVDRDRHDEARAAAPPELASTGLANVTNAFYPWE